METGSKSASMQANVTAVLGDRKLVTGQSIVGTGLNAGAK